MYTVLARRYRSQTFDDVIGQDSVAQTLKNSIESGRIAHAYLFCGTRGVGKTTMARILAKSLNCLNADGPTTKPCLKCDSCIAVNTGEDIDVLEIDGASNNGVENIRDLRQNAIYRPARARFKIYIIDEVHMLSSGAFNALLKILEEPPGHVKFIFATTEPNKVLPTIQSRCQRFDFANISSDKIAEQLKAVLKEEKIKAENDLVIKVAKLANGSMRDGLSLLDQLISTGQQPLTVELLEDFLGQPSAEMVNNLLTCIGTSDAAGTLQACEQLINSGHDAGKVVESLIDAFRDIMVVNAAGEKTKLTILTDDERKQIKQLGQNFDLPAVIYFITMLEKLRWTIRNSDNPRAILDASLLRMALAENFIGTEQLLEAIGSGSLEQKPSPSAGPTVKKKSLTPVNNNSASRPANSPEQIDKIIDNADLENIRKNWKKIVKHITPHLARGAGLLVSAHPEDFKDNQLTLSFPKHLEMGLNMLRKPQTEQAVRTALSKALGMELRVKFLTGNTAAAANGYRPRGAKLSKEQRTEIVNLPAIKTVIEGLNATVTSVEASADE